MLRSVEAKNHLTIAPVTLTPETDIFEAIKALLDRKISGATVIDSDNNVVGVISDTHGLVRPEALRALEGVEHILHAGDVGSPDVLEALRELAPLTAVRGNVDASAWAADLPETVEVEGELAV